MVSKEDVIYAYRMILGREPESVAAIQNCIESFNSWAEMRTAFLLSKEFRGQGQAYGKQAAISSGPSPRDFSSRRWPRNEVEVDVSPKELASMLDRTSRSWRKLGQEDPHWSVITQKRFRAAVFGINESEFYALGEDDVAQMKFAAARCGIDLQRFRDVFELGCGVGRLSIWLAKLLPVVLAADISAPHLEIARETLAARKCSNVDLLKIADISDLDRLPEFDVFFSLIVLQHNPPPVMAAMLSAILGKLRPGGIGFFQLPTNQLGYRFQAQTYLEDINGPESMEMHVLPQDVLFELIEKSGCRLLEIREDGFANPSTTVSNSVLVQKR